MRAEGVAVLLVEQDLHLAFAVADEIAVMEKGAIVHRVPTPSSAATRTRAPPARRGLICTVAPTLRIGVSLTSTRG